jgi:hypothetical protein
MSVSDTVTKQQWWKTVGNKQSTQSMHNKTQYVAIKTRKKNQPTIKLLSFNLNVYVFTLKIKPHILPNTSGTLLSN